MISSSQVSSLKTDVDKYFTDYGTKKSELEPNDVWEGKSKENAIEQMGNFEDDYKGKIASQLSDFTTVAKDYEDWVKVKKDLEDEKEVLKKLENDRIKYPDAYIDTGPSERKISGYETEKARLEKEINEKIDSIISNKIDITNVEVKTPDSYKLYDFVNFYQYNYSHPYGDGTIANCGCGPTSMAMVLTYLLGENIDPVETSDWSMAHNGYCPGEGTYWSFFPKISQEYGVECEEMGASTGNIRQKLSEGKVVIMSMGPGHFTSGGHFIVLRGINPDGSIKVDDPASEERTNQSWSAELIASEAKGMWAFDSDRTAEMTI